MPERDQRPAAPSGTGGATAATVGAGAAALAAAAGACCAPVLAPLIVALLGASGAAWAAGLKPYSGAILVAAGGLLAYGYWAVYRRRRGDAAAGCPVRRPLAPRLVLWAATLLWLGALVLNLAPTLSGRL